MDNVLTSCTTNEDCLDRNNFFCNVNTTLCQRCPSTITFGPDWHVDQCFDSTSRLGLVDDSSQSNCAEACHTECQDIREGSIILVQEGLVAASLQSAVEDEQVCNFCPDDLERSHWDHEIPFIGSNATCYKLNQFFLNYELPADSSNCQLSLNFNYICDCEGKGYAGADTDAKKKALVWVPRVSGILSFIGSCAIIIDVLRDRKKRKKLYCQLMVSMSVFDLMGSVAYSLTTLPIPSEYYIEGSKGNDASCTAQASRLAFLLFCHVCKPRA